MKHSVRSTFTALLVALAFACAGFVDGGRSAREPGGSHGHGWQERASPLSSIRAEETPALLFLRVGFPLLDKAPRRAGALPRVVPIGDPSDDFSFATRAARQASGTHTRRILTLTLARHLAAARDGTLSSHSTGVPPPIA